MTKTLKVLFDGTVFRPSGPVDLEAGKKYTITIQLSPENSDATADPAFDIASLAVDTHISDLAAEHDHYLYGTPKRDTHGHGSSTHQVPENQQISGYADRRQYC
ncbi:hypothetical protein L21_2694 [Methanoculleus chikugoensis]|uniref:DUF104 domain-containing protein n=1 Tax=Methanoculleus chikugoensis TaxID=118126 RepID=A0A1M4MP81_9EURY|nr:antitoxin family protein [Methanoculleus chikugoensis]SCL76751.1 hypothetical protein L21_2694 [Methanoculleus chikugoensis]